jgi:hypothetical protein
MTMVVDANQRAAVSFNDYSWGAIIAGSITAAALALVLKGFGLALGLSISSASPTWRDTSFALVLLSGLYLVLVALASYGLGGYVAGRTRRRLQPGEFVEFDDGMHGLVVWGIATILAGVLAAVSLSFAHAPGAITSTTNPAVPGENLIASELDRLFRGSERRNAGDLRYDRAEAARILMTVSSHSGMDSGDRVYLAHLVAANTGAPAADAERRVDEAASLAKQDISRARSSAVILAFMAGAAALLGAIVAWAAAVVAGQYRDGRETVPYLWDWRVRSHIH